MREEIVSAKCHTATSMYECMYPTVQKYMCCDMNRRRYEKPWVDIVAHQKTWSILPNKHISQSIYLYFQSIVIFVACGDQALLKIKAKWESLILLAFQA